MYKLFQFFLAHYGYARINTHDITGFIRAALEREKSHADLQALRAAAETFVTEIDMELERRGPEPSPLGVKFDDWLNTVLPGRRHGAQA